MKARGRWQGMMAIARFNWPFYLGALLVILVGVFSVFWINSVLLKFLIGCGVFGAVYFVAVSLGVSHWIYDRSDLYRFAWLERAMAGTAARKRMVFCHSGFDEASLLLREKWEEKEWEVLDHYDEEMMSEPSIQRARALFPPVAGTVPARFDRWPVHADSVDAVFGILAIHEFRSIEERAAWFAEAGRCLGEGGRIILVEHVRDLANFIAFGPGFMHFHSVKNWHESWEIAGLKAVDQFRITPFVRVFIITKK